MEKLIRILHMQRHESLLKEEKKNIRLMRESLKKDGLACAVKNETDYYRLIVMYRGLINKKLIESCYDEVRNDCIEMWNGLEFTQRNKLVKVKLDEALRRCPSFICASGKQIVIPFFDELLNSLYIHEPAVLELPQYYRLYKQYKDRMIDVCEYGLNMIEQGFAEGKILAVNECYCVIYEAKCRSLIRFDKYLKAMVFPLDKDCLIKEDELQRLADILVEDDERNAAVFCMNSVLFHDKVKKKLQKERSWHQ